MLSSVLRVVTRAAAIQLEQVIARSATASASASVSASATPGPGPSTVQAAAAAAAAARNTHQEQVHHAGTDELRGLELPPIRRGDRIDGHPLRSARKYEAVTAAAANTTTSAEALGNSGIDVDRDATRTGMPGRDHGHGLESSFQAFEDTPIESKDLDRESLGSMHAGIRETEGAGHGLEESFQAFAESTEAMEAEQLAARKRKAEELLDEADLGIPGSAYSVANTHGRAIPAATATATTTMPIDSITSTHDQPSTTTTEEQKTAAGESSGTAGSADLVDAGKAMLHDSSAESLIGSETIEEVTEEDSPILLRASKVPSSRLGRLFHYGSLAASLSLGAASESIRRTASGGGGQGSSVFMSDANIRRLVSSLSRMRGAALKLGQFMSIQDNNMLPPEIERVLQQVQAHANYMPDWQMEKVMRSELGSEWTSLFSTFDRTPIASASIGQVHRATLSSSGESVAVKVQFPGIQESISSDLSYLTPLLATSSILPKGLYLQNTIAVMKRELADECDYIREADAGRRFKGCLEGDEYFDVPRVIDEASSGKVLTTAWMEGRALSRMKGMKQDTRDKIGTNILRLCLIELFKFRFMQTDPNWANFLYNPSTDRLGLIDFGASRDYTTEFMDSWHSLLTAALNGDRVKMREESENIGYFTGEEEQVMIDAHLSSMQLLSQPFAHTGLFDFSTQTITTDVRKYVPIMLKHRLTPPPPETYSLNRKLSGAFLMCAKLGARVDCQRLWEQHAGTYVARGRS